MFRKRNDGGRCGFQPPAVTEQAVRQAGTLKGNGDDCCHGGKRAGPLGRPFVRAIEDFPDLFADFAQAAAWPAQHGWLPIWIGWVKEATGNTSTGLLVLAVLPLIGGLLVFLGAMRARPRSRTPKRPLKCSSSPMAQSKKAEAASALTRARHLFTLS
jgi:hypothetical protein